VAPIVDTEALSVASTQPPSAPPPRTQPPPEPDGLVAAADWHPKRRVRTVLSSIAASTEFGKQRAREAKRRRFPEARARAFWGDGLPWNGSIGKQHFPEFTPIWDFIHVLSYLFLAAQAVHDSAHDAWDQYWVRMRGAWQGAVAPVIAELCACQAQRGVPDDASDQEPPTVLAPTINDLENHRDRMKDPEYRRAGWPVTTAGLESLVKEMNDRVTGTEMFWNDPDGAEAILPVRAAAPRDDDRLAKHLVNRPGCWFTRRPQSPNLAPEKIKS
jgi:hypothetical protein